MCRYQNITHKQPNLQSLMSHQKFSYSFSFFHLTITFLRLTSLSSLTLFHIALVTKHLDNISTSISLSHTDSTFTHLFSVTQVPRSHRSSPFLISLKLLRSLDHTDRLLSHLSQATQVPRSHRPSPFRL